MPTIRVPLAEPLTNRDSSTTKDSKLTNCFIQNVGGQEAVIKRPGLKNYGLTVSGQGLGSFCSNSLYSVNYGVPNRVTRSGLAPTTGFIAAGATYVCNNKSYAYVVAQAGTLYVVDISVPTSPVLKSTTSLGTSSRAPAIVGNFLYIPQYSLNKLASYDVTNPAAPVFLGSVTTAINPTSVSSDGSYLYVGSDAGLVQVFTVASIPVNTGVSINVSSAVGGYAIPSGGYLYITNSIGGSVYSYNITNPLVPTFYKSLATGINVIGITVNNTRIYGVGSSATGNHFVVIDTTSMTYLYNQVASTFSFFTGITNIGTTVYASSSAISNLIDVIDASFPTSPTYSQMTAASIGQGAFASQYGGVLVVLGAAGLRVFDTNNQVISVNVTANVAGDSSQYQWALPTSGSTLLVLKNNTAMSVMDTSTGVVTQVTSVNYPPITVPGLVQLDGTYYVGTADGKIFGSAIGDPTTWSALNYISAEVESDNLVAIEKSLNYLVAFGQWTTEFFYDAGNATGSPLSSVPNAFFTIGCASGNSVVRTENAVIWMSQTIQRGRQIRILNGFQPEVISTPEIDRVLNADDLATVYSFSIRTNGSTFYVLTLKSSNKTLVYDLTTKQWHFWSSMAIQSPKSVTSLTYANGVVTVTQTAHGYADGDLVTIAGATPSGYNGNKNITYIDSNTYSYLSASVLSSPATGTITATGYTEQYFRGVGYTNCLGGDLFQDESTGTFYKVDPTVGDDDGAYINTKLRTARIDGGDAKRKFNSKAEIIGDKIAATAYIRYTDDDYQTYCTYRPIDLSAKRSMILRLGHTRRRAYEIRVTDSQPLRVGALEIDLEKGTS